MSNEMIERVANAIHIKMGYHTAEGFVCNTCMGLAKSAIEAMREPTEEMLDAAMADEEKGHWQAMIDAALKDG